MSQVQMMKIGRALNGVVFVALVLASSWSCGRKSPPIPPPSKAPAAALDLTAVQRGSEVLLELGYPTTTAGGLTLEGLSKVEIYTAESAIIDDSLDLDFDFDQDEADEGEPDDSDEARDAVSEIATEVASTPVVMMGEDDDSEAPEVAERASTESEDESTKKAASPDEPEEAVAKAAPKMRRPDFAPVAELVTTLEDSSLSATVIGDRIHVALPLEELDRERNQYYGAIFYSGTGLQSEYSNIAGVQPSDPPPPPSGLSVTPSAEGITLDWNLPGTELEGFHVYRRSASSRRYGKPLVLTTAKQTKFVDRTAPAGGRFIYTVTSVLRSVPLTESSLSAEFEVDYRDRFAPPVPEAFVALTDAQQVRLLWEGSNVDDLAGYLIERKNADGKIVQLTPEPITSIEYIDRNILASTVYQYRIWSVDQTGNESEPTDWINAPIP